MPYSRIRRRDAWTILAHEFPARADRDPRLAVSLTESVQNAEIFTLTYGSLIRQLLADYDDLQEVHRQLEKMFCPFIPPLLTLRAGDIKSE